MNIAIFWAFLAGIGTWAITAVGAATVIFFKTPKQRTLNFLLGFSGGVMIAASFWSLLQPAIEIGEETLKIPPYIVVTAGFLSGAGFIWFCDKMISQAFLKRISKTDNSKRKLNRIIMLILSITLHNIPEGLAVGVGFGLINQNSDKSVLMGAISIAVGIGLQNFPEGAAVSLPLRRERYSRKKSFFYGQLSAIVEPIAAIIGAALVTVIRSVLTFALSFAAGAMIIVSVHELIPECQKDSDNSYKATIGIISGFALMMLLDVMLG